MKTIANTQLMPSAHVTVNHNRRKSYDRTIFMKDGTEYEIELFNPSQVKVLAKIEIDGKLISSNGIILNPGERSYLERWIDSSKKLLFKTYEIEDTEISENAVLNNGIIKIEFFQENTKFFNQGYGLPQHGFYYQTDLNKNIQPNEFTITCSNGGYNSTMTFSETGMSEQGNQSQQKLIESSGDFYSISSKTEVWKILPESKKPIDLKSIKQYCTNCSQRIRKESWKFCPSCGEKL